MHWLSEIRQALTQLPPTFVAALEPNVVQVMTTCYSCKSLHALAIGNPTHVGLASSDQDPLYREHISMDSGGI